MSAPHQAYLDLLASVVNEQLTPAEFSQRFFKLYHADQTSYGQAVGLLLDELMALTDAYCEDPDLRDELDIDEAQFLTEARELLPRLQSAPAISRA